MEPDMEDLTAMIPKNFDFVEEIDNIFDEDKQPTLQFSQPPLGKCQSLFTTTHTSL